MIVSILCSSREHPIYPALCAWRKRRAFEHEVEIVSSPNDLLGGDVLFLISCSQIVERSTRARYEYTLVLHASDLPRGRGWSPHIWSILEGATEVIVSLLNAADNVDTGAIWGQRIVQIPDHALYEEINTLIFQAELSLMDAFIDGALPTEPEDQSDDVEPSYYPRRRPQDSEIDPTRSLAAQFDAIRVADPHRFPAFFRFRGHKYIMKIEKLGDEEES